MTKRTIQIALAFVLITSMFASVGGASAWSGCSTYITVQWGDTLSGIAKLCGTTIDAIRAANPGLGWWLYAGQVLYIPSGYTPPPPQPTYNTYVVRWGDTLKKIAAYNGVTVNAILSVNPQIYNANLIYAGQVINLPAGAPPPYTPPPSYPPPSSDSYSTVKIDYKYGLYVRSDPNGKIIASALNNTAWRYRQNSLFVDSKGRLWVEVKISPPANGYYVGWILVKDQLGTYFTDPPVDNN